ncbi:lysoplasmalogenase family protein [Microbacterium pseudoresistens]|uniref:Lysoplasmalogenase n=1 Tax=Microbacterium pseudoresistens TaxID=640634 RepID=A0A7Y9EXD6_9MICO|nr:lysoplasmalogenase [Microbacterium pseudoresistens]NYD55722.1 hypothetical protein [Microbacterium pseudoresistens]
MHSRRLHSRRLLWTFVPFVVVSVVHVIALATNSPLTTPTKLLLMPLLAVPVVALWTRLHPRVAAVILGAALLFSWLGDEAGLFFPALPELPLMLGFFGIAHIAYILLFARFLREQRLPIWTLAYALWWMLMMVVLAPRAGELIVAVALYGAVLAGTAAMASRCAPMIAWGGLLFLASDTILAFRLFLPETMPAWTSPAVMLTYTLGQGLLVAGSLRALAADRASAAEAPAEVVS